MDKNSVIGFLLIIAVIFGFSYFNRPSEEQLKQQREEQLAEEKQQQDTKTETAAGETTKAAHDSIFTDNGEKQQLVALKNKDITVGISTRGGSIGNVVLKNYKGQDKKPLLLYSDEYAKMSFTLAGKKNDISVRKHRFLQIPFLFPVGILQSDHRIWKHQGSPL